MKIFIFCLFASVITASSAVFFRKFDNSHCKCIPKNYPCVRKGYRINFNFGRHPSACLPNLILCCDEGKTAFVGSKESLSNKIQNKINYLFNGSPRSISEIKNRNNNNKLNIHHGSETILVPSLSEKVFNKMGPTKTENLNRNLKIFTSDHIPTTPLTKNSENVSNDLLGSKEFENNQSDTNHISHRGKPSSNLTNLLKIFRKSSETRNISNVEVIRNEPNLTKYFPSFDPSATNINLIDMESHQRESVTVNATNPGIDDKAPNRHIIHKGTSQNEARNKNKIQNYNKSSNPNNLPISHLTRSVNFEKITKPVNITVIPTAQPLGKVSIPGAQTLTEEVKIPDVTTLIEEIKIPSVAPVVEATIPSKKIMTKEVTMPRVMPKAEVFRIPTVTANSMFKSLAEDIMPTNTTLTEDASIPLVEEFTMPSTTTLTEEVTMSSIKPVADEIAIRTTTSLAEVTIPSVTPLAEVVTMPSTTNLTEETTMLSTTPLAEVMFGTSTSSEEIEMSSIKLLVENTMSTTSPLTEEVSMPINTPLAEVLMLNTMVLAEEVTMSSIKPLVEVTMPTTTPLTEVTMPTTTPLTEETMPSVTSLDEEETMSSVTSLIEEATMPSVTSLIEEATMPSVTPLAEDTKPSVALAEETTMLSVTPLGEEATILSVTSYDEDRNTISDYIDYTNEEVKDGNFSIAATKELEYENQSQTYSPETTNSTIQINTLKGIIPFEVPARGPYSTRFSKFIVHPRSKDTANLLSVYNESIDELLSFSKTFQMSPHISKTSLNSGNTTAAQLEIMEVEMLEKETKVSTESDGSNTTGLNNVAESKHSMVVENVTNSSLQITKNKLSKLPEDVDETGRNSSPYSITETTYYENTTIPQIEQKQSNSVFNWLFNIF